jgi:thiol-disulfide isomerase/thioredoxin
MRLFIHFIIALLSVLHVDGNRGRDFYKILGIPRNAKDAQIKKAYRELSRKYHPDQNPDNKEEATQKFYDISAAYETLIDSDKRAKYDLGGEEAVNGGGGGGQGGFQRGDPFEQFRTFFQFFGEQGGGGGGGFHHGGFPGGGMGGNFHHQHAAPQNMYDEKSGVTEISNVNDWNAKIQSEELKVIEFYSPNCKPCQDLKVHYISIAKQFRGILQVLAVNCQGHATATICQSQNIRQYPTIRLYLDNKKHAEFPASQAKTSKAIGNWIANTMPDFSTRIDSKKSIDKFIASAGNKAVVFLFSDKKETPAMYKSLCRTFKTNVACGIVLNYSPSSPPGFVPQPISRDIQKTPSLFYLHDSVSFTGELFKGSMTSEIISLFFSRIVSHRSRQVNVDQLTSSRRDDCSSKDGSICILLIGNPTTDPSIGLKYDVMKQLADRFKSDPVKFFWVDSGSKFVSMFTEATAGELIAFRGKRNKYAVFEGGQDVTFEATNSWIDNIISGGSSLTKTPSRKASHDEL